MRVHVAGNWIKRDFLALLKLVNFAHGQFLMIGAFAAWAISVAAGLNAYIAILISIGIVAAIGVVVQRFTFRRFLARTS